MNSPSIIYRSDWQAKDFIGAVKSIGTIRNIVVHHAQGYQAVTLEDGKQRMRDIQNLHQGTKRRWSDIGYHFVIDGIGQIYQGRPFYEGNKLSDIPKLAMGAHVLKQNAGKVGICLLGCFHPPEKNCSDIPSQKAMQSLEILIRFICKSYNVNAEAMKTHRDFIATACPGDRLYNEVEKLRQRLLTYVI